MSLKKRIGAVLICLLIFILVAACAQDADETQPVFIPVATLPPPSPLASTPTPAPVVTPTPLPSPSPTPTMQASIYDFLPMENIYIAYDVDGAAHESYVEYFDEQQGLLQKRTLVQNSPPYMQVFSVQDQALSCIYRLDDIGYTHSFLKTAKKTPNFDEILLKEPIALGNRWSGTGYSSEITDVNKPLTLPIGNFNVVEVTTTYEDRSSVISHYAQGVGLVSQYRFDDTDTVVRNTVAVSREKDRPFKQRIRFFFADQSDWSIKYITRDIHIKVNSYVPTRFCDELRKIPTGSYLVPFPTRAKVLSVTPAYKGGIKVDLSDEFVTQMQVGRSAEKLMLQAIANTFGEYYQADKVYITLQGQLYESPYFMFINKEEYLSTKTQKATRYNG